MIERRIADVLQRVSCGTEGQRWRAACIALDGPLRVLLAGAPGGAARRLAQRLADHPERSLDVLEVTLPDDENAPLSLALEDAVLSAHVILWATPIQAPLGQRERWLLQPLGAPLLPIDRALIAADEHLLSQLSDDPDTERAEVLARLRGQPAPGWSQVREPELDAWLDAPLTQRTQRTRMRKEQVARFLLAEALSQAESALRDAQSNLAETEAALAEEQALIAQARSAGDRTAARVLAAVHHHAERVLVDLHTFARDLEADLAPQTAAVDNVEILRRTMPHWLDHVMLSWLRDRLTSFRVDVLAELAEVGAEGEAEADAAELLAPAINASHVRSETSWTRRVGATAAVGAGMALLTFGLLVPGALAVSSGLAWSSWQAPGETELRTQLLRASVDAVRRMASEAELQLRAQLEQLTADLTGAGDLRAERLSEARASVRAERSAQRSAHQHRVTEHRDRRDDLAAALASLTAPSASSPIPEPALTQPVYIPPDPEPVVDPARPVARPPEVPSVDDAVDEG